MTQIAFLETTDRAAGVRQAVDALRINPVRGKDVLIKPNFNTADPAPGSTHNDTLASLIDTLHDMGAKSIALGERSYPLTRDVMTEKGVIPMLREKNVHIIDFDDLPDKDWVPVSPVGSHWKDGLRIARPILEAECLVSTGCIKTHQFGGVITLSLKLHVGVVPTFRNGYSYMDELHASPHQQELIAEINAAFAPYLIVMDGVDAFVDGGPASGKRVSGNVILAGTDRVAIDAVGVAVLKQLGSNPAVMGRPIFAQRQISRAAELGLGVRSPEEIDLIAADPGSAARRDAVHAVLMKG